MSESAVSHKKTKLGSPDRFGYEWAEYHTILPESQDQLIRWLGSTGIQSFQGKEVLDVGCGMGRNPYWMLKNGAKKVVAADVDAGSLASAKKNLAEFPQAQTIFKSAYEVSPQDLGTFDRVTCIGVLHHLEDPRLALRKMWSCVRPGGDLLLWCYGKQGNHFLLPFIQACRFIGSRLPIKATHVFAKLITAFLYPFIRVLPFKTEYFQKLKTLSYKNIESIVFDQMLPHIAHYWTREDLTALTLPLENQVTAIELVQGNSWHVRVFKKEAV